MLKRSFDIRASADAFKDGMSRLASGVSLVTGQFNGHRAGLIATSVASVCIEPPTLLVCVNQSATAHDAIDVSGHFCVNLLKADDLGIAQIFSRHDRYEDRFETGDWQDLPSGPPILLSAMAAFECAIMRRMPFNTHTVFFGSVVAAYVDVEIKNPLIYYQRGFKFALEGAFA